MWHGRSDASLRFLLATFVDAAALFNGSRLNQWKVTITIHRRPRPSPARHRKQRLQTTAMPNIIKFPKYDIEEYYHGDSIIIGMFVRIQFRKITR